MNYTAVAKVTWYFDNQKQTDYIGLTYVHNFTEAMQQIEEAYGDDLDTIELTLRDETFIPLRESDYEILKAGGDIDS